MTRAIRKKPRSSSGAKHGHRQRVEQILQQRERLIGEVQKLSAVEGCAEAAGKAWQLLTRWWARADWNARAELLRVAEWVIRVEAGGRA